MKKVVPKKKIAFPHSHLKVDDSVLFDAFHFTPSKKDPLGFGSSNSASRSSSSSVGIAREKIHAGDLVMLDKNGEVMRFTGSEGRKSV